MKKFSFKVGVYDLMCHVIIADDIEKIYNKLAKKNGWNQLSDDTEAGGLAIGGDLFNYYIFYKTNSLTPGILAHEASHIVDEILQNRGIELVGEARAYLTQHIHLATLEENLLNLEDKEMCTILTKYKEEISFDNLTEEDMNKLVLDTESLFKEVEWDGELLDEED